MYDLMLMAGIAAGIIAIVYIPLAYLAWRQSPHQRRLRKIKQRYQVRNLVRRLKGV